MNRKTHRNLPPVYRLGDVCSLCHTYVEPKDIVRLDWDYCRCPHCGGIYSLSPSPRSTQAAAPAKPLTPSR
jgi:hypothetical protein